VIRGVRLKIWRHLFLTLPLLLCLGTAACDGTSAPPATRDAQTEACVPNCAGKKCGSDGCGGICGVCLPFESCTDRQVCLSFPCARMQFAAPAGCCVGEVLLYCSGGAVVEQDCSHFLHCGWNAAQGLYLCNTAGGEDPSGKHDKACP
jgi:hypothetical protein